MACSSKFRIPAPVGSTSTASNLFGNIRNIIGQRGRKTYLRFGATCENRVFCHSTHSQLFQRFSSFLSSFFACDFSSVISLIFQSVIFWAYDISNDFFLQFVIPPLSSSFKRLLGFNIFCLIHIYYSCHFSHAVQPSKTVIYMYSRSIIVILWSKKRVRNHSCVCVWCVEDDLWNMEWPKSEIMADRHLP